MKKRVAILLCFLSLALIHGVPVIMYCGYQSAYKVYSEELCENTDKPDLQCNGKCQLAKKLVEVSQDEESGNCNESSFPLLVVEGEAVDSESQSIAPNIRILLKSNATYLVRSIAAGYHLEVAHPPNA